MHTFIFVLHIFSCLFLIGFILLQSGQGANMGAAFGGASNTVFGSRGPATILNKMTIVIAVIFLAASLYLAHAEKRKDRSSVVTKSIEMEAKELETGSIGEEAAKEEENKKEDTKALKEEEHDAAKKMLEEKAKQ